MPTKRTPAGAAATASPKNPAPAAPKSKGLIAAEHKHKLATEVFEAAQARATSAAASADAIDWNTPLGSSIRARAEEVAAEKALKLAKSALNRAKHKVFIAGGQV